MADTRLFWLGTLGNMNPIACPEGEVSSSLVTQAASNVSIANNLTYDLQGIRREWQLSEAYLHPQDVSYFESMISGIIIPPFRIIDPLRKNRLKAATSSGSIHTYLPNGWDVFYPAGGSRLYGTDTTPLITYTAPGESRQVSYRPTNIVRWDSSVADSRLWLSGRPRQTPSPGASLIHRPTHVDVVLPGETITVTFVTSHAGGAAVAGLSLVAANMSATDGPEVTLPVSSTYTTTSITYTVPTNGSVVAVAPYYRATTATATAINTAYTQLEQGSTFTGWELGYGAPECVITDSGSVSPQYPLVTMSLTIREM